MLYISEFIIIAQEIYFELFEIKKFFVIDEKLSKI